MNTSHPKMHASFHVSDLSKSIGFYTRFFGQEPLKVREGYAKFELEDPALVISFIERPDQVHAGFGHLGFQVGSQEDLQIRLLQAQKEGLVESEEKETRCCYAMQDKFWVTDPDGIRWEVYFFHKDVEENDPKHAAACCAN